MDPHRTLYLVDGTYLLYRAYHSLPASMAVVGEPYRKGREALAALLREGAGTAKEPAGIADVALGWLEDPARDRFPTNAVRGLASVLIKLIRDERPTHMGVAFDLPGKVHRDDHYSGFVRDHPDYAPRLDGYKATRDATPTEVVAQFAVARILCSRALGIPVLEAAGFEADDLIGTLARRARDKGCEVRLVTADKDLYQLVEEGVSILNPHRTEPGKGSGYLLMDAKVIEKEFGVPPAQVVDVLALMGDTSDNIPGVPGIGEKGAKDLIRAFGSVEGCIEAAKEEGKITRTAYRKGLQEHAALALFSKELATIREDAPVDVNVDDVWTQTPDREELKTIFGLLAFDSLLRDVEALAGSGERGGAERPMSVRGGATGEKARSLAASDEKGNGGIRHPSGPGLEGLSWEGVAVESARSDPGAAETNAGARSRGASIGAGSGTLSAGARRGPGDPGTGTTDANPARGSAARSLAASGAGSAAAADGGPPGSARAASHGSARAETHEQMDPPLGKGASPGGPLPRGKTEVPLPISGPDDSPLGTEDPGTGTLARTGSPSLGLTEVPDEDRYRAVLDTEEIARLLPEILASPRVAVHVGATSRDPMRAELAGIAIAWEPRRAIYVPLVHRYLGAPSQPERGAVLHLLAPLLEDPARTKVGQNVKFELEMLGRSGLKPAGFRFDTLIAAFMLESDRLSYALDALAREYLGEDAREEEGGASGRRPPFDEIDVLRAAAEAGREADLALRLAEVLEQRLDAENLRQVFETIDMPLVEVLAGMETAGVRIDVDLLRRLSQDMGSQITTIRDDIHRLAGHEFNVDSPRQLAKVLFEELGLQPVSRTAKSRVSSTRDEDLEILAARHPLPARARDYRVLAKLRSTYVDALPAMLNPRTGRVHTSFNPAGAATGRLSSSDPNLQNIPVRTLEGRKIRAAFVPEPGWLLVSADYSQVELRVMAHLSGDGDLVAAFERDEDIHRSTAARIFNVPYEAVASDQRRAAKTINFGILYGMGSQRLARDLGITQGAAREMIESYFGRFPRIRAYIDGTIERAERDGFVSTLFGRIRRFPGLMSPSRYQRQLAVRQAVNSTIQGTAADLMKIAMIRLDRAIRDAGLRSRLLIQVHDELVLESPPDELDRLKEMIREAMEVIPPFELPLKVDISAGSNWLEAKS